MYKQILTKKTIWSVVTILFLSASVNAELQEQENQPEISEREVISQPINKPILFTLRKALDSEVRSSASIPAGTEDSGQTRTQKPEKIGTVAELIINEDRNSIDYVVLVADKTKRVFYPVPWSAFDTKHLAGITSNQNGGDIQYLGEGVLGTVFEPSTRMPVRSSTKSVLYLNITKEQLMGAPSVTSISTELLRDPAMRRDIDNFYAGYMVTGIERTEVFSEIPEMRSLPDAPALTTVDEDIEPLRLVKFSALSSLEVKNTANEHLGKIYDLVADAREGKILYSLVHYGGWMGIMQKNAAVPWNALTLDDDLTYARIDATRETLDKASVEQDKLHMLNQPVFVRAILSEFGMTPSPVYGFVPGGIENKLTAAWEAGSDYNKLFDISKLTSIRGTIREVGTYEPASGTVAGIKLTVETEDGRTVTVYAGPQQYAGEKNFSFSSGSEVEIEGSKAVINDSSVIMASQIEIAGKTLKLYDREGKPQWNIEKLIE